MNVKESSPKLEEHPKYESPTEAHVVSCLVDNLRLRITQRVEKGHPLFVGIGGFTALGKTTLARTLLKSIPDSSVISMDSFMLDRASRKELGLETGDDPRAIDFNGLLQAVNSLRKDRNVQIQEYNHVNGKHDKSFVINPSQVIIVEGTTALYPQIQDVFQLRIFLDANPSIRKFLLKSTEIRERGYSKEEFEKYWPSYVRDNGLYIQPSKMNADIICNVNQKRRFLSNAIQTCSCV